MNCCHRRKSRNKITTSLVITTIVWRKLFRPQSTDRKSNQSVFLLIFMIFLQVGAVQALAANRQLTDQGSKAIYADDLLVVDQGRLIVQAMAGSWEYGVYLLGLPVGLKAKVEVLWDGHNVTATSQVNHFLAANNHQSVFSLSNCDYRLQNYQNSGFSPGWRFDDAVVFDWQQMLINYKGLTQGPKTPDAQPQAVTLTLDNATYVDKLSQFAALACALKNPHCNDNVMLSYVDDTIGRYIFSVDQSTVQMSFAGQTISVIKVESEPYDYVEGSVHRRVTYWLAPSLGFLPVKISTKLGGMRLTVKLLKTSKLAAAL
ncbi:MAG: hypothetical protein ACI8RT_000305 [Candidatus Azotimanducaceae bacterium]|jgi:hypothetical protein